MSFPLNSLLKSRWKILSKIGQGAFGETFIAEDIETREKVAIKTESAEKKKQMLKAEVAILKSLQGQPSICRFYGCGRFQGYNFIVMELLGHNLSQLRRVQPRNVLSVGICAALAIEMLGAIQILHEFGYLHRDVKPSNFALGLGSNPSGLPKVIIIDFGLSRKFRTKDGKIKEPRNFAGFRGTARYASINSHQAKELSRSDDLWSLFYLIVQFLTGNLPWKKEKDRDRIGKLKEEFTNPSLVKDLPNEILLFLRHLEKLGYKDEPDYEYLKSLLEKMLDDSQEDVVSFFSNLDISASLSYSKFLLDPTPGQSEETISADIPPCNVPTHNNNDHDDDTTSAILSQDILQYSVNTNPKDATQGAIEGGISGREGYFDNCEICQRMAYYRSQGMMEQEAEILLNQGVFFEGERNDRYEMGVPPAVLARELTRLGAERSEEGRDSQGSDKERSQEKALAPPYLNNSYSNSHNNSFNHLNSHNNSHNNSNSNNNSHNSNNANNHAHPNANSNDNTLTSMPFGSFPTYYSHHNHAHVFPQDHHGSAHQLAGTSSPHSNRVTWASDLDHHGNQHHSRENFAVPFPGNSHSIKSSHKTRRKGSKKNHSYGKYAFSHSRTQTVAFSSRNNSEDDRMSSVFDAEASSPPLKKARTANSDDENDHSNNEFTDEMTTIFQPVRPPSLSKLEDVGGETEFSIESTFKTGEEDSALFENSNPKKRKITNESFG